MSLPSRIAELIGVGTKALGKATVAFGNQAYRNIKYKPEGVQQLQGGSAGKKGVEGGRDMTLEEAHLILNVKDGQPMEVIRQNYERIFNANGPPKEPEPKPGQPPQPKTRRPPQHSHYLQSKVYRALERIKEERGESDPPAPTDAGEGAAGDTKSEGGR